MNSAELSKKIEGYLKGSASKAKKFEDLVAVTISLVSEEDEDLYVCVKDGKLDVAPYRYNDFGCAVEASAETVDKIFSGAVSFDKALADGLVRVCAGDVAKFKALEVLVPSAKKAPAKAPAEKKACGKCAAPKAKAAEKPAEKPAAKAVEKPAAKAAEKPAVKAAEKPAVKAVEKPAAEAKKPAAKKK